MDLASLEARFEVAKADPSSILIDRPQRKAFRSDGKVVKFGFDTAQSEPGTLAYLQQLNLNVEIPKVLSSGTGNNGFFYIEMKEIEGTTLYDAWLNSSDEEKRSYAQQMRDILRKLRSFKGAYIGGVPKKHAIDMRRDRAIGGPYETEADFNEFLLANLSSRVPKIFQEMLRTTMSASHDIVLTHGDLSARNILTNEGKIVGLIDWEFSGFYPEYWEYAQFFRAMDTSIDWHEYAEIIFEQSYPQQYITDNFLGRLSKH